MAVISSIPVVQLENNRCHDFITGIIMDSGGEIEVEPEPFVEEKIYVAVGKEIKESKSILLWSLQKFKGEKFVLLHVHQPAQNNPTRMGKFHASKLKEQEVRIHRQSEKEEMMKTMEEYKSICARFRVQAEKLVSNAEDVQAEIVELIARHGISKLVMGAAADKYHSRRIRAPKSKKAIFVEQQASAACQIWFVCKGSLVCIREAKANTRQGRSLPLIIPPSPPASSPGTNPNREEKLRSKSMQTERGGVLDWFNNRPRSTGGSRVGSERSINEWDRVSLSSTSLASSETWSVSEDGGTGTSGLLFARSDGEEGCFPLPSVLESEEHSNAVDGVEEARKLEELQEQLEVARGAVRRLRKEASEASIKFRKAEEDARQDIGKAKESENAYIRAVNQRKESEEMLNKKEMELENLRTQLREISKELEKASAEKSELENRVRESDRLLMETERKLRATKQYLERLCAEKDDLQRQRDNAVRAAEELRVQQEEQLAAMAESQDCPHNYSEFSYLDLREATNDFDPALKIGHGGYGTVYRGVIRHAAVAIKMLNPQSRQGRDEFQQEVDVLSRMRHPNLVTLIGICPEYRSLIYEYLPNGSLEDRLNCKDNTPPLPWQTRTRVAAEICNALLFLHSARPHSVVHGDLKPANILLDDHFVSKLGDFGICRLIQQSDSGTTLCRNTSPKGTFAYIDPEFFATGILTLKSDVYSFGVVILQLLTGKPALGLVMEVKAAVENRKLQEVLDRTAGEWPFVQAQQLAYLGLKCCEMNRRNRPDLSSEVWRVLEAMTASSSSSRMAGESSRIPAYFICPIFQEIMRDPHVAADGYTYEAEALKGWLDSGDETSPVTNLRLAHTNLTPNRALRSAIQEWLQQH